MRPGLWAEIHRLHEVEKLSQREIASRIPCSRETVRKALVSTAPPTASPRGHRASKLDPYKVKIAELLARHPRLSAMRIGEEIRKFGYSGGKTILTDYVRTIRPARKRVYQEVDWTPGDAMQVDWGHCGCLDMETTRRRVSVFAGILCYSRILYIEFTLDQRKDTFYRCIVHALEFFGGSPRHIIVDNLKAAVCEGHGRDARYHPAFLDLCGYYRMQPVACQRKDPESKGMVESAIRYVKNHALSGRVLDTWEDYQRLAPAWLEQINARQHRTIMARPMDRLKEEDLQALPPVRYDTSEAHTCVVSSHARVCFESNRYSVGPEYAGKTVTLKADHERVRIFHHDQEIACHGRCYEHGQRIVDPAHRLAALARQKHETRRLIEAQFDALDPAAASFRKALQARPLKSTLHLRRILRMVPLYGKHEVLQAMAVASMHNALDAAYVENLILQARRRRALPSPLELRPARKELLDIIDLEEPDPAIYDTLIDERENDEEDGCCAPETGS
jgi:transposase